MATTTIDSQVDTCILINTFDVDPTRHSAIERCRADRTVALRDIEFDGS